MKFFVYSTVIFHPLNDEKNVHCCGYYKGAVISTVTTVHTMRSTTVSSQLPDTQYNTSYNTTGFTVSDTLQLTTAPLVNTRSTTVVTLPVSTSELNVNTKLD